VGKLREKLISLFYPNRCFICDKILPHPETVCEGCCEKLIDYGSISGAICDVCGLKLQECNCRPGRLYEKAVFPLLFEDDVRVSLHRFKFRGRLDKAVHFADAMLGALEARDVLSETDILTFIPMSPKAQRRRGYNQAQVLCEELQKRTSLPMLPLLYKYGRNNAQHDTSNYLLRTGNTIGIYEPTPEHIKEIEGKRILLVDDILTSGATLNEAAKTLLIFGADRVYVAAAAATPKRKKQGKKGK
jgi:ComF family protein